MSDVAAHPLRVVHHQSSGLLALQWSDGLQAYLTSQTLRGACRCAACEKMRRAGAGSAASAVVRLVGLVPVGEIGLQLRFDDGHDRGIYPWPYLHDLSMASQLAAPA